LSAVAVEYRYCPQARQECVWNGSSCDFCGTDHMPMWGRLNAFQRKLILLMAQGYALKAAANHMHVNYNNAAARLRDARLAVGAKTNEQMMVVLTREGSLGQ
jgi:hypothetical protein